jgi:mannose/fructose/sorbose-specific phosphotransferase system IIA component
MIGIVVVTHGELADGIASAVTLIAGPQEQFETVALREGDSIDGLKERIQTAIDKMDTGSGSLVFVDMLGASPSNAAAYLVTDHVEIIAGVNLPMILEILAVRGDMALAELAEMAMNAGKESIQSLSAIMRQALKNSQVHSDTSAAPSSTR